MVTSGAAVRRLDLGSFVRPAAEVAAFRCAGNDGAGCDDRAVQPRVEPVLGYVVRRDEGTILFDTGIGAVDAETEAHYRPRRRDLVGALATVGMDLRDIALVVNCHLHFDHCGGNALLAGRPILVQSAELASARGENYTVPELVDFAGADYREFDGEAEVWPGVWIIPTPGHTDGHQSLVVRQPDGTVVLAGQAHDFASEFGSAQLAREAADAGVAAPLPPYPAWLRRLTDFDPRRVLFAHDQSVWEPA